MNRHLLFLLATLTVIFAANCGERVAERSPPANSASPAISVPLTAKTNPLILDLEARIKNNSDDFIAHNKLVTAYLQQFRESGDVAYLGLALRASRASLDILPAEQNKGGLAGLARAQFASHDFAGSRDSALRLVELDPNKAYVYQLLGDAYLELGDYSQAKTAFNSMEELGTMLPLNEIAIEQRFARLALLYGDTADANRRLARAIRLAEEPPGAPSETIAFTYWQLGETAFASGDYKTAEVSYRASLKAFPNYFKSLASLGRAQAALGDLPQAIELFERVTAMMPDPSYVGVLGDLYHLSGREDDANRQYELVEQISKLDAAKGNLYNREFALFCANRGIRLDEAYTAAAEEYKTRRDIYGADVLAWAAFKAGRFSEARTVMAEARKLGTRDARIYYHAGMIEKSLDNKTEARKLLKAALKLNPAFDPRQAAEAKRTLDELGN